MKHVMNFLNKTIKGGIFFIVPITLLVILFGKVFQVLKPIAQRISGVIDQGQERVFDLSYIITIVLLFLICFIFGLAAASAFGKAFVRWIEDNILVIVPGYQLIKNAGQAAIGLDDTKNFPVVLVPVDGWMIAFLIESISNDELVVFVPGSPNPWSGNVLIFNKSEIKETSMTQKEALGFLKQTGMGLQDLKKTNN